MMIIRGAIQDDAVAISLLMLDLGYPASLDDIRYRFANILKHPDYKTLLAVEDENIIGMIGMSKNYFYEFNSQYIRILALVVSHKHRNKGIGKKLLSEAEKWAIEINADTIVLNSGNRPERQDAYIFYQKIGFKVKSTGFVKKLSDQ